MKGVAGWNFGALGVAIALGTAVVWAPALRGWTPPSTANSSSSGRNAEPLVDHSGVTVPAADYVRIASISTVADELLLALCEPDRVIAFTGSSARSNTKSYRFRGKPTIEGKEDLETLLALHPDLILLNRLGDARPVERMREAGLVVFDLGEMGGLTTLLPNIREVAALIGHPERGERVARALVEEMNAVAADVPASSRKRGLYLSVYGGHLFGGARGTSYLDVLTSAGLGDAAPEYLNWPEYAPEQLLALDPDVIVTRDGMRARVCEHVGLGGLRACGTAGGIVEIAGDLLDDPGPAMLDAAEAIRSAVYGAPSLVFHPLGAAFPIH